MYKLVILSQLLPFFDGWVKKEEKVLNEQKLSMYKTTFLNLDAFPLNSLLALPVTFLCTNDYYC